MKMDQAAPKHFLTVKEFDRDYNQCVHKFYWDPAANEIYRRSSDDWGVWWKTTLTTHQALEMLDRFNDSQSVAEVRRSFRLGVLNG